MRIVQTATREEMLQISWSRAEAEMARRMIEEFRQSHKAHDGWETDEVPQGQQFRRLTARLEVAIDRPTTVDDPTLARDSNTAW